MSAAYTQVFTVLKPLIWSYDTGQWIQYFDRCQLTMTWMSNVWFQKISIPPPQREFEIPEQVGESKTQEVQEGRGFGQSIYCPDILRFNTDSSLI